MFVFVIKNSDFVRKKYPSLLAWNISGAFEKTKNLNNHLKSSLSKPQTNKKNF